MMHQVIKSFPNDKPITAIGIVEDVSKCPQGFYSVSKTYDQDADADLWKETSIFSRRTSRYLCLSKTEGIPDYIVEDVVVIDSKENPPDGYCLIQKTIDGDSKAWKKRQLCYRLTRRVVATKAISDIILLSKTKRAPDGFYLAGDISGITLCFKTNPLANSVETHTPILGYSINPLTPSATSPSAAPLASPRPTSNGVYPGLPTTPVNNGSVSPNGGEYVNVIRPKRPAPKVPPHRPPPPVNNHVPASYGTLNTHQDLEGIPFVLHPKISASAGKPAMFGIPQIKAKTKEELDREYHYDFRLERQT